MTFTAWAPGTAGELVQGWLDGEAVQVTAPIDIGCEATVAPGGSFRLTPHLPKVRQALDLLQHRVGRTLNGTVTVRSELPMGKGFGSSTADIVSSVAAAGVALDLSLEPRDLAALALAIEPTDGVMFDGIVLWGQRSGHRLEPLGQPPDCIILIDDGIGHVNTDRFAVRDRSTAERERVTSAALALVRAGIASGDVSLLGQAASLSAAAHQRVLFKPALEAFQALGSEIGAAGCCIGHSGTLMGLILDPNHVDCAAAETWLSARWSRPIRRVRLTGGGVRVVRPATLTV